MASEAPGSRKARGLETKAVERYGRLMREHPNYLNYEFIRNTRKIAPNDDISKIESFNDAFHTDYGEQLSVTRAEISEFSEIFRKNGYLRKIIRDPENAKNVVRKMRKLGF